MYVFAVEQELNERMLRLWNIVSYVELSVKMLQHFANHSRKNKIHCFFKQGKYSAEVQCGKVFRNKV